MSMQIRFLKNPKGVLAVDAEPGEERWVPRALANQLINRGFAASVAALERGGYETAETGPDEKAVVRPSSPRRRGGRKTAKKKDEEPAVTEEPTPGEPASEEPGIGGVAEEPKAEEKAGEPEGEKPKE